MAAKSLEEREDLPADLEFLRPWLDSPDPALRRHAEARVALARGAPLARDIPRRPRPTIPLPPGGVVVRGVLDSHNGYGLLALRLVEGLRLRGVPVAFHAVLGGEGHETYGGAPVYPLTRYDAPPGAAILTVFNPDQPVVAGERTAFFTMWETTRLRASQVANLNRAQVVVVPCRWCRDNFAAQGVSAPIRVVPLGWTSADGYGHSSGEREDPPGTFRVGMAGRLGHGADAPGAGGRKGIQEGIAAFRAAFPDDPTALLEVKVHPEDLRLVHDDPDPRIRLIGEEWPPARLAGWYRTLDLLLVPSKGEGWGLHTLQAMACGVPAAAAVWSGTADFLDGRCGYPLDHDVTPVPEASYYKGLGAWCEPRHRSMVATLLAARHDPEARRAKGAHAARMARNYTWDRCARETLAVLGQFGMADDSDPGDAPLEWERGDRFLGAFVYTNTTTRLDRALGSLAPFVDRLLVGVDEEAPPEVAAWLGARDFAHFRLPVRHDHATALNRMVAELGTRWVFNLDADEEVDPEAMGRLRATCRRAEARGVDGMWFPRRHWRDLGRTRMETGGIFGDDRVMRLYRGHMRWKGRVHSAPVGVAKDDHDDTIVVEHLNLALRSAEDWARVDAHYAELRRKDEADEAREREREARERQQRVRPAATSAVPSVREVHRKLARMRSCPHWSHPPGMG